MARCGCGGACGCSVVGGTSGNVPVTVTGTGTPANPFTVNASVACSVIRPCLSAGTGIDYDPVTGIISAEAADCTTIRPCLSGGSGIAYDSVTGIITNNAVTSCGIIGNGTAGSPLMANTNPWPYPCDVSANGGIVACDPTTGKLYSTPVGMADIQSVETVRNYAGLTVPTTAAGATLDTFSMTFTNNDACRNVRAFVTREVKVDFDMPGTSTTGPSRAAFAIDAGVDTYRQWNNGITTTTGVAVMTTRSIDLGPVAPGANLNYTLTVVGSNGMGGATYTRITVAVHVLFVPTN